MSHFRKNNNSHFDGRYLPSYPLIWTPPEEIKNKYTPFYDVMITHYFESDLLNLQEIGFYCLNQTYAKRGQGVLMSAFSRKSKIGKTAIVAMIDKFQDLELASRIARTDHKGYPNDIVLQPPKAPKWLDAGGAEQLRKQLGTTKFLRKELGKDFPTVRFSERSISKALGRHYGYASDFHKFCILQNYYILTSNPKLIVDSKEYKDIFLREIYRWCQEKGIEYRNETIASSALEIARNYGQRPQSISQLLEQAAIRKHKEEFEANNGE